MKNLLYQTDIRFKNITSTSAQLYKQDVNKFEILKKHITGRNVNIFSQMKNNSGNTHFQIANYVSMLWIHFILIVFKLRIYFLWYISSLTYLKN